MPKLKYSYNKKFDEEKTVRATGKELRISFKDSVEICRSGGKDLNLQKSF
jgi:ribosomal protein L22